MSDSEKPDVYELNRLVKEYKYAKEFSEKAVRRSDELKMSLITYVRDHGTPDDRGHKWLSAGDAQIKHERRVSKSFDTNSATDWAKSIGIWDEVKEIIETLSEDAVLKYVWEHPEHQDTLTDFYTERESWAFKVVDQKSYDDE